MPPTSRPGRFRRPVLAIGLLLSALALGITGSPVHGDDELDDTPDCIGYRGDARYRGLGYDHVVVLVSSCEQTAHCTVSTDVTPEEHETDVPPGETAEVLTRRGSPARAFTPRVACTLR